jgi:two-component system, LytTR family, sensor kinase
MSVLTTIASHYLPLSAWPKGMKRTLLLLWCLFWLLMIFVAIQDNLNDMNVRWWQPLLWEGSSTLVLTPIGIVLLSYSNRQHQLLAVPWRWVWQHMQWLPLMSALSQIFH